MSHFTVLVIGPDHEQALAPFHEFECTGRDDEFVVDVDKTEEARAGYEKDTERMVEKDGVRVSAYDDQFYRDPTDAEIKKHGPFFGSGGGGGISYTSQDWGDGKGHRAKVLDVPEGWEEVTVPTSETRSFVAWCEDYYGWTSVKHGEEPTEEQKYGYVQLDENGEGVKCIDRTNPNAKWDWYVIGGRWCGYFPLKDGAKGIAGQGAGAAHDVRPDPGTADQLRKDAVDFEKARDDAEEKGRERFAKWQAVFEKHGKPELSWPQTYAKIEAEITELEAQGTAKEEVPDPKDPDSTIHRAGLVRHTWRERYREQAAIAAYREVDVWTSPVEEFGYDEDAYAQSCRNRALVPFAIVKDGKWFAKGDMGWWGAVSDERVQEEWNEEVSRLYDDLPPDTLLTLVDCHI